MTVSELIRQCGNPEYTILIEGDCLPGGISLNIFISDKRDTSTMIGGYLVRLRNQDGAELDRVAVTDGEIRDAIARGAKDQREVVDQSYSTYLCDSVARRAHEERDEGVGRQDVVVVAFIWG